MVSIGKLTNGEKVIMGIIEIMSIPHISIIDSRVGIEDEIVERYKRVFENTLNEAYQSFKTYSYEAKSSKDISFELLWVTEQVDNQSYKARIRLFIIVRVIDSDDQHGTQIVESFKKIFGSMLTLQKYDYEDVDYENLKNILDNVDDKAINAIVKEENVENLQNSLLPYCYSFDKITDSKSDLSKIVSVLIDYPNCAVSMQLIPTVFTHDEMTEIDKATQLLETLNKGVSDSGVGNISFTLAEKHAKTYKYYSKNKNAALFNYNILVYGSHDAAQNISNKVYGQIANGEENINLKLINLSKQEVDKDRNFFPLPWAVNELLINKSRNSQIWQAGVFSSALYRLPYVITMEEAAEFFRLPIGSNMISAGLIINESSKGYKTFTDNIINTGDITVGKLKSSANEDTIGFDLKDLAKHMLVVGTPGSGKTTFSIGLLDRLWKEHHIPFLVIEPAKNEYRALIQSIPDIQVFTPGKNFISPFVFNPFALPKNVKLETYKSTLKTAFSAAVSMSSPLDKIFEESINNCYSDFRWLDTYTSDDKGEIFNISDFIKCFQKTFESIGYTGDANNIGRAGVVRLNSLINLFDNYHSIPIEDILNKPTIIELAAIENSDQKALIISLLLLSILVYVNANYIGTGGLKNVILLEEAHVLLDADTNTGQGEANPSAIAQRLVKRMLAEIRSYGVGVVIADQSPKKVTSDVVALTDMKVIFRLVESNDKQIIADSTNMTEVQVQRMSKLRPGEAFLFFNKLDEPEEIITPDYRLENNIDISLSDDSIKELSAYWNDKKNKLRPYPQCEYCSFCKDTCDYNRRVLAKEIARRVFGKYFKPNDDNFKVLEHVFGHITKIVKAELYDEELTPELMACIKVHLWRKIYYGTRLKIKEKQIENSVKK